MERPTAQQLRNCGWMFILTSGDVHAISAAKQGYASAPLPNGRQLCALPSTKPRRSGRLSASPEQGSV